MTTRDDSQTRTNGQATRPEASGTTRLDTLEERVVAFAEQLGRLVGTVQAKAEGWTDREALKQQIANVRDGATELLRQMTGDAPSAPATPSAKVRKPTRDAKGRSGGVVDAPGKKHRKPVPRDSQAKLAATQAAKLRAARPMKKTPRRRGRG